MLGGYTGKDVRMREPVARVAGLHPGACFNASPAIEVYIPATAHQVRPCLAHATADAHNPEDAWCPPGVVDVLLLLVGRNA